MERVRQIGTQVSNWGRWGAEDQVGALNLIGAEQVVEAARLVRKGTVIRLGLPFAADGPLPDGIDRRNPLHLMTELGRTPRSRGEFRYTDDWITMPLQASTHWDALAHVILDGAMYNGFKADEHITPTGATRCAIDQAASGVVGRGVLLDVAGYRGVAHLRSGEVISPGELDAVAEAQKVTIKAGDIILLRTGWWEKYLADGSREGFWAGEPGPGLESAQWFRAHDIAGVCADNFSVEAVEHRPDGWASPEIPDQAFTLHVILSKYLGMMVGELYDLTQLAADCAQDNVYEFLFCAPPLPVSGAVGSPVNPLAIK
jgi:kynurenine formamidase